MRHPICEIRNPKSEIRNRRIVVKAGTSTLTDTCGRIDRQYIQQLAADLASLRENGWQALLVTSGAIRAGQEALEGTRGRGGTGTLPYKQAAAAVGQGLLMQSYSEAFGALGIATGQVLLTRDDLADRRRYLNARNTLSALLSLGAIPIVNENDTVAVEEIRFGDNDTLAARVAVLVEAELLLILSDVDGLIPNPKSEIRNPKSESPIPSVLQITREIEVMAGGAGSDGGTGGMITKVEAAKIATAAGIRTVIAHGRRERIVAAVAAGEQVGTTFEPRKDRPRGRKRWIAAGLRIHGALHVNSGAAARVRAHGASLLAVGIQCVEGDFEAGDLVELRDESGLRFARGLANYSAADIRELQGLRSDQFRTALGFSSGDEIVHRDNLVVET